jgi:hypothetical protein
MTETDPNLLWKRICDAEAVLGYALTSRRHNTPEWMEGFIGELNRYCRLHRPGIQYAYNGDLIRRTTAPSDFSTQEESK